MATRTHPRLQKVFRQAMSTTSLKMLLRDPIRFVWRYALGWRQPEESEEPLMLDALAFGNLVHEILQTAVNTLESNGGFGNTPKRTRDTLAMTRYADCQTSMTNLGSNVGFSKVVSRSAGCGP
jgi:hypothetical protein